MGYIRVVLLLAAVLLHPLLARAAGPQGGSGPPAVSPAPSPRLDAGRNARIAAEVARRAEHRNTRAAVARRAGVAESRVRALPDLATRGGKGN